MTMTEIDERGEIPGGIPLNDVLREALPAVRGVYERNGFVRPWIGYVALKEGACIGMGGFKSPPQEGRVEIAYGAMPGCEGRGVGTQVARELVRIALAADPNVQVFAQTLPHESGSTSILKKLGFRNIGTVDHPEDGLVWDWELQPPAG